MAIIRVNQQSDSYTPVGVSSLGTIVYDNVLFPAGTYTDLENNPQNYPEVKLDAVTLGVNRRKNIVKSQISGRDGDFKEYISAGDYIISMSAIIAPDTINPVDLLASIRNSSLGVQFSAAIGGVYVPNNPDELLYNLARLEEVPKEVAIRCKFLQNNFEINFVVIEDMRLKKIMADTWSLDMTLLSDFGIDLKDFG